MTRLSTIEDMLEIRIESLLIKIDKAKIVLDKRLDQYKRILKGETNRRVNLDNSLISWKLLKKNNIAKQQVNQKHIGVIRVEPLFLHIGKYPLYPLPRVDTFFILFFFYYLYRRSCPEGCTSHGEWVLYEHGLGGYRMATT